jgi:predicted RNA binding protein YcfA (HicA-like mRNA interferase family)
LGKWTEKKLIKILEKQGFKWVRINGSYHIMSKGNGKPFSVPVHAKRDLKIGRLISPEVAAPILLHILRSQRDQSMVQVAKMMNIPTSNISV